jgi:hypothetical protein
MDFHAACPAALRLAVKKDDRAYIKSTCEQDQFDPACRSVKRWETFADLAEPDCSTLTGRVAEARKSFLSANEAAPEELAPVVAALARCGDAATSFEGIAAEGEWHFGGFGGQVLSAADKAAGPALLGTFEAYMKAKAGAGFLEGSGYAAHHVAGWLLETRRMDLCRPLAATLKGAHERVVANIVDYFKQTECKEAAPLAVELLASDDAEFRQWGCAALALLGDKSHLRKLGVVAESDSASRPVEHSGESTVYTKGFFVADSCRRRSPRSSCAASRARRMTIELDDERRGRLTGHARLERRVMVELALLVGDAPARARAAGRFNSSERTPAGSDVCERPATRRVRPRSRWSWRRRRGPVARRGPARPHAASAPCLRGPWPARTALRPARPGRPGSRA